MAPYAPAPWAPALRRSGGRRLAPCPDTGPEPRGVGKGRRRTMIIGGAAVSCHRAGFKPAPTPRLIRGLRGRLVVPLRTGAVGARPSSFRRRPEPRGVGRGRPSYHDNRRCRCVVPQGGFQTRSYAKVDQGPPWAPRRSPTHRRRGRPSPGPWIPAFAGMTDGPLRTGAVGARPRRSGGRRLAPCPDTGPEPRGVGRGRRRTMTIGGAAVSCHRAGFKPAPTPRLISGLRGRLVVPLRTGAVGARPSSFRRRPEPIPVPSGYRPSPV